MKRNKVFPLSSRIIQRGPLSPPLFNIVLEVLPGTVRQDKEKVNRKGRIKIVAIAEDMTLYVENPKD